MKNRHKKCKKKKKRLSYLKKGFHKIPPKETEELNAKFQDIQMLKFGQTVDLDLIERSAPNTYVKAPCWRRKNQLDSSDLRNDLLLLFGALFEILGFF